MKIYHGHPSPKSIDKCREAAPSYTHGAEWSHAKMTPHDWPYILDNGAFAAYKHGEPWDVDAFAKRLGELDDMPRDPDFVILPDVVTNPEMTKDRSEVWSEIIDYRTAFPCQDGIGAEEAAEFAEKIGSEVLFIGGTVTWKKRHAESFVKEAHGRGLDCHIGRPGDLTWARDIGADSVDTTTIVQSQAWEKLEQLEQQQTLKKKWVN